MHGRALQSMIVALVCGCGDNDSAIRVHNPPDGFVRFFDVWAAPGGDVLAVGQEPFDLRGRVLHWHDGSWTSQPVNAVATSVWGHSDDLHRNVWIGGVGYPQVDKLLQRENDGWYPRDEALLRSAGSQLGGVLDVWSSSPENVWTIADRDAEDRESRGVFQWNGEEWIEHERFWPELDPSPEADFTYPLSVCGTGPNDVWVAARIVGAFEWSIYYHWNGADWQESDWLCDVRDMKCDDEGPWVLLDCDNNYDEVRRLRGEEWELVYDARDTYGYSSEINHHPTGLALGANGDFYIAGYQRKFDSAGRARVSTGVVWHVANGEAQELLSADAALPPLSSIAVDGAGRVWAVGDEGAIVEIGPEAR